MDKQIEKDPFGTQVKLEVFCVNSLVGGLLDILDAAIVDKDQRGAIRKLVISKVWGWAEQWQMGMTEEDMKKLESDPTLVEDWKDDTANIEDPRILE